MSLSDIKENREALVTGVEHRVKDVFPMADSRTWEICGRLFNIFWR